MYNMAEKTNRLVFYHQTLFMSEETAPIIKTNKQALAITITNDQTEDR